MPTRSDDCICTRTDDDKESTSTIMTTTEKDPHGDLEKEYITLKENHNGIVVLIKIINLMMMNGHTKMNLFPETRLISEYVKMIVRVESLFLNFYMEESYSGMIQSVTSALVRFKFEAITVEQNASLLTVLEKLEDAEIQIESSLETVTDTLNEVGIDISTLTFMEIEFPPVLPKPFNGIKQLEFELTNLLTSFFAIDQLSLILLQLTEGQDTTGDISVSVFLESLKALQYLLFLNQGYLWERTFLELASSIITMSKNLVEISADDITEINSIILVLFKNKYYIQKDLHFTQSSLIIELGISLDFHMMEFEILGEDGSIGLNEITVEPPQPLLPPSELATLIQAQLTNTKFLLTNLKSLYDMLIKIEEGTFTIDADAETSPEALLIMLDSFGKLVLTNGDIIAKLEILTEITALSVEVSEVQISLISIIIDIIEVMMGNLLGSLISNITLLTDVAGLVISLPDFSGGVLNFVASLLSLVEDLQANCAGLDSLSALLLSLIPGIEIGSSSSPTIGTVLEFLIQILQLATTSLADASILTVIGEIQIFLVSLDFSVITISLADLSLLQFYIFNIQTAVMIYVSQIMLVNQIYFQYGGELTFTISIEVPAAPNVIQQIEYEKQQLIGAITISDITDASISAILLVLSLNENEIINPGGCGASTLQEKAFRLNALCSAPVLDTDVLQESAQDLIQCANNLESNLSPGQLSFLIFVQSALQGFILTFSTQVVIIQQRLVVLTGVQFTAVDLGLQVIDSTGNLVPATAVDYTNNGAFEIGSLDFLQFQWQEFRFGYSTLSVVLNALEIVFAVNTINEDNSLNAFLALGIQYLSLLRQGIFTTSGLQEITTSLISMSIEVNMLVYGRFIILFESIMFGIRQYQIACISAFINLQWQIIAILQIPITSLQISFDQLDLSGSVITVSNAAEFESISLLITDLKAISVQIYYLLTSAEAALNEDFSGIVGATVSVNATVFVLNLESLMIDLGLGFLNINQDVFNIFITYKVVGDLSVQQLEFLNIAVQTLRMFYIQLNLDIAFYIKQLYRCEAIEHMGDLEEMLNIYSTLSLKMQIFQNILTTLVEEKQVVGDMPIEELIGAASKMQLIAIEGQRRTNETLIDAENILTSLDKTFTEMSPAIKNEIATVEGVIDKFVKILEFLIECISSFLQICPVGQQTGQLESGGGFCCCKEYVTDIFLTTDPSLSTSYDAQETPIPLSEMTSSPAIMTSMLVMTTVPPYYTTGGLMPTKSDDCICIRTGNCYLILIFTLKFDFKYHVILHIFLHFNPSLKFSSDY